MKIKQQINIDRYIAMPVAFLLNLVVRIVGKILSIDHKLDKPFKRFVICKFKGLGSIIQSTPILTVLRNKYPDAEIIFVSTKSNAALLHRIKIIDKIIIIDDNHFFKFILTAIKAIWQLIKFRPEVYIDLEIYSNFSTIFTTLTLAKNRIGFYLRSSSFKMGIYTHMMFFNAKVPISQVYLQIARLFDNTVNETGLYPLYQGMENLPESRTGNNYIVVNPNASDLRIERRWDANNFALLIQKIVENHNDVRIMLIGSASEYEHTNKVMQAIPAELHSNVTNVAGTTTFDELILLIRNAKLIITNDTGPMHIGFACNTPAICLFGPCSPDHYGWYQNTKIIYHKVYCSPCIHDFSTPPCKGNNTCMQLITVEEVFFAVNDFFEKDQIEDNQLNNTQNIYNVGNLILGLVNR